MTKTSRSTAANLNAGNTDAGLGTRPGSMPLMDGVRNIGSGIVRMDVHVPGMHCAGCISKIEKSLVQHPAIEKARVSLSDKRVTVDWQGGAVAAEHLINQIENLGYEASLIRSDMRPQNLADDHVKFLIRAMAVAGFAAANIMLLSVSVWSGAEAATRDLFHWLSAMIAIPAVAYAGRPFFSSAFRSLRAKSLNMDVPISLAVILAMAMSLYQVMNSGEHAYFDAAVMLLFFLLVGRVLDQLMRARANTAAAQLAKLSAPRAHLISPDGHLTEVPTSSLGTGDRVMIPAGDTVPADGTILIGNSDLDHSLINGEAVSRTLAAGDRVFAGMVNLTGPLEVEVTATGEDTFLAEISRLMQASAQTKARYVRLADKAARIYAPVVHMLAGLTFIGWIAFGADWQTSLFTAIAVLIITCPCALGLAVPVVQVVATGQLFRKGVLVKDGAGLEKMSKIDTVIFDKTGTLTKGEPVLVAPNVIDAQMLSLAAGLARHSHHPLSRAVLDEAQKRGIEPAALRDVEELPGKGLLGMSSDRQIKLGSRSWCDIAQSDEMSSDDDLLELFLVMTGRDPVCFRFRDALNDNAKAAINRLKSSGLDIEIVSGDRAAAVRRIARDLGVENWRSDCTPRDKVAHIGRLSRSGRVVMMVGDGLNDAPALAAGAVSMAPSTASDIGRIAADFVYLGRRLGSVADAIEMAKRTDRLVKQNFGLAVMYNLIAIPVAVAGLASPLVAAIAMSSSSLVVVTNALRLKLPPMMLHFWRSEKLPGSPVYKQPKEGRSI